MIPRRDFDRYCRQVDNLAEDARLAVAGVLEGGIADPGDVAAARDLAISALTDVLGTYAVASAAAAADFYERSGGSPAVLGDADLRAIEGTVRYQAGKLVDGDVDGFVDQVSEFAAHAVKLSANKQMIKNAEDGSRRRRRKSGKGPKVRFARVPTGPETCTFCTMLASRGFVYWSREDAGEFGHFHRKCDCKVVASTDAEGLEGYDPERYARLHEVFRGIDSTDMPRSEKDSLKRTVLEDFNDGEPVAAGAVFLNSSTKLYHRMKMVKPIDGYFDVGIHSDGRRFLYTDADDKVEYEVDVASLADWIRRLPGYEGGPIRLLACDSGRFSNGAAKELADELGVVVSAPDKSVYVDFDGKITLADSDREYKMIVSGRKKETGQWHEFPKKKGGE